MPARSRSSPCCKGTAYTTERFDPVTGDVVWRANLFKTAPAAWNLGKYVACEYLYEVVDGLKMIVVGGVRAADRVETSPSVTFRNVAAFDFVTGDLLWEHDCAVDCIGYDPDTPSATPETVMCIAKDPDGNVVCMLRRFTALGHGINEYFYYEDAHWVTLDPTDGSLIEAKTFTNQNNYHGHPVCPISFDIDDDGKYHIVGIDADETGSPPPTLYGSPFQFLYEWVPSFSSPPTLYETEFGGGDPRACIPTSLIRRDGKDWLGGYSVFVDPANPFSGLFPGADITDIEFLHGAVRASSGSIITGWPDIDVILSKKHSFSDVDVTPVGISQGSAAALTNAANNVLQPFSNSALVPFQGVILPDGAQYDVLTIDTTVCNADATATHFYQLYPPVGGRIIFDFIYVKDVDEPIVTDLSGSWSLSLGTLKCTCFGNDADGFNVWLVEIVEVPIICNTPYPAGDLVYTVGRYGLIVKWKDGDVESFVDCARVQAIADSDGNTYGTGALQVIYSATTNSTITKRDADGVFQWAHVHAGAFHFVQAPMLHLSADESALFVSGSAGIGGPMQVADSIDFITDPCIVEEVCHGFCKYIADTDRIVEITSSSGSYTFDCHAIVTIKAFAGGGGGGGAIGFDQGGGGGAQGSNFEAIWNVLKGTVLHWGVDPDSVGGGHGGSGPDGADGEDGADLRVWTALTDPLFILPGGAGGKGTNNAPSPHPGTGGIAIGIGSVSGADGSTYAGGNGGGFGFDAGPPLSGAGATGNAFGNVDPPVNGASNGGGGGGGYDSDGADGYGEYVYLHIQYLKWEVDTTPGSSDCEDGCVCRDADGDFTDQFGCPFNLDATTKVRCATNA